jgi:hypothetical protein
MRFSLEVVVSGKQDNTCRIHSKYADNVDFKTEIDDIDGNSSKNYAV